MRRAYRSMAVELEDEVLDVQRSLALIANRGQAHRSWIVVAGSLTRFDNEGVRHHVEDTGERPAVHPSDELVRPVLANGRDLLSPQVAVTGAEHASGHERRPRHSQTHAHFGVRGSPSRMEKRCTAPTPSDA